MARGPGAAAPGRPTGFTRAGSYTYDDSWSATTPLGTKPVTGTDTYTADAPRGTSQHSTQANQQGSQELTLAVTSGGLHVVDLRIHQQTFDEDFRPTTSPAVYFPSDYRVGRAWSWSARSTDGTYTVDVSSRISGTASVVVGGHTLPSLVVDSVLHITGNGFDVTDDQRDWVSTTYALVLREHAVTHGTVSGFAVTSDVTRVLRSTSPS